jgi:hypothetical protein
LFDHIGDFHSDAVRVVERFSFDRPDTIRYEATIEDPKVFTTLDNRSHPGAEHRTRVRAIGRGMYRG